MGILKILRQYRKKNPQIVLQLPLLHRPVPVQGPPQPIREHRSKQNPQNSPTADAPTSSSSPNTGPPITPLFNAQTAHKRARTQASTNSPTPALAAPSSSSSSSAKPLLQADHKKGSPGSL